MINLIFDFDGVIYNTLEISYKIQQKIFPGITLQEYKNFFCGNLYESPKIRNNEYVINKFFEMQEKEYLGLKIDNKIKKFLTNLSIKHKLFIVTSNKEKVIQKFLEQNDMKKIFTEVLGFETDKSKEIKFKILFSKYGFDESNCYFITDTLGDILEANKMGIRTIAIDKGYHERELLEKGNPHKIISDLESINQFCN